MKYNVGITEAAEGGVQVPGEKKNWKYRLGD